MATPKRAQHPLIVVDAALQASRSHLVAAQHPRSLVEAVLREQ